MGNKKVLELLNDQMNYEFYSAHLYLGMAGYCSSLGLKGFENWFKVQYQEEVDHAMKFFDFINSRGGRAIITNFPEIENEYKSIIDVFEHSLEHEKDVSMRIHNVGKMALENTDLTAFSFLQWFIDEQVEEEDSLSAIIDDIKRVDGNGIYLIDRELASRVYTPQVV